METNKRTTDWNALDQFLSRWRAKFIVPHLKKTDIVCDIGCGQEGKVLMSIASHMKRGYGYDLNFKGNPKPAKNILLSKTDFLAVQKTFDVIILLAVLEHFPYPDYVHTMLDAIYQKLKPGGTLILTTPDKRAKPILEFLAYKLHSINEEEIRDHKHYFNKQELLSLMKRHGFTRIRHKHFQLGLNNLIVCQKER